MEDLGSLHYDVSNASENVDSTQDFKQLNWYSVQIPTTTPKSDHAH